MPAGQRAAPAAARTHPLGRRAAEGGHATRAGAVDGARVHQRRVQEAVVEASMGRVGGAGREGEVQGRPRRRTRQVAPSKHAAKGPARQVGKKQLPLPHRLCGMMMAPSRPHAVGMAARVRLGMARPAGVAVARAGGERSRLCVLLCLLPQRGRWQQRACRAPRATSAYGIPARKKRMPKLRTGGGQ